MITESRLARFLQQRLTLKRRRPAADSPSRNNKGIGPTGVVVTIIILAILAAVGGPPLFGLIFDAREFKLESNVREAAQIVQQRLTLEPDWMGTDGFASNGVPEEALLVALTEDAPYDWETAWALGTNDDDNTIRIQAVRAGRTSASPPVPALAAAATAAPPAVDWLAQNGGAVRVHARNADGRWACALVVVRPTPNMHELWDVARYHNQSAGTVNGLTIVSTTDAPTAVTPMPSADAQIINQRLMNAWLSGIWYDSGDVVSADNGLHDCSPVDDTGTTGTIKATLPTSASEWNIEQKGATNLVREFSRSFT